MGVKKLNRRYADYGIAVLMSLPPIGYHCGTGVGSNGIGFSSFLSKLHGQFPSFSAAQIFAASPNRLRTVRGRPRHAILLNWRSLNSIYVSSSMRPISSIHVRGMIRRALTIVVASAWFRSSSISSSQVLELLRMASLSTSESP